MKPYIVKENSWHFKFLTSTFCEVWDVRQRKDFCSYWRLFIINLFGVLLCSAVVMLIMPMMGMAIYQVPKELAIVLGIVAAWGLLCYGVSQGIKRMKSVAQDKQPSFLATKYKAWKGKHCPMVEYE